MKEPIFRIGKYVRAPDRSCGSAIAHADCKFAGKGWRCDAPSRAYSECPYKAILDVAVFDDEKD
jgi:hypothetical protein